MNFYLPDFYFKFKLNMEIIDLFFQHPEYFHNEVAIGAIYGSFPGAIWNGGRQINGIANGDNIKSTLMSFNDRGIPIRFTFTNCLLEEKHLYDTYCNFIMEVANNGMNEILVNSPLLEQYLRDKYPNFKYILSTTICERDVNKINSFCDKYDLVVTDYRDNNNDDFLSKLKSKDKIELLVNAYCSPNCELREHHYKILSQGQLNFTTIKDVTNNCETQDRSFFDALNFPTTIKIEDIYNKYVKNGFEHFKIEGRLVHIVNVIESYVYYMVKPEYKDKVRLHLLKRCCQQWN